MSGQGEPQMTFLFWAWHLFCPHYMTVSRPVSPTWSVCSLSDGYRLPSEDLRGQEIFVCLRNMIVKYDCVLSPSTEFHL